MTPPRSATTSCLAPAIVTVTWANPTGTEAKLRQPRTLAYSPVSPGSTGGTMSTRPSTRTQSTPPYPGKGVTVGWWPRARARRSRQAWKRYSRRASHSTLACSGWFAGILSVFHVLFRTARRGSILVVHVTSLDPLDDLLPDEDEEEEDHDHADEEVARVVDLVRELPVRSRSRRRDRDVERGPHDARGSRPRQEPAVAEPAHPHGQRHEGVQHRKEAREEDRRPAPLAQVALRP